MNMLTKFIFSLIPETILKKYRANFELSDPLSFTSICVSSNTKNKYYINTKHYNDALPIIRKTKLNPS